MPNFSASQSFSTQGLCETFKANDTSDYMGNSEGYSLSDVDYKIWTFRNASGAIIKQETVAANVMSSSISISLLTLSITVELIVRLGNGINQTYSVQNSLLIPCIGV